MRWKTVVSRMGEASVNDKANALEAENAKLKEQNER